MRILRYNSFINENDQNDQHTRTKELTEEEFLSLFRENCNNFSFENTPLYRGSYSGYDLSIFTKSLRKSVATRWDGPDQFGAYKGYADLFRSIADDIKNFPVERSKSLIGITHNASFIKDESYIPDGVRLVIPYDGTEIVIGTLPDIGALGRSEQMTKDDFIMMTYEKGFTVPKEKLLDMRKSQFDEGQYNALQSSYEKYGFEYFTNGPCLLVSESKIDWLKENIN